MSRRWLLNLFVISALSPIGFTLASPLPPGGSKKVFPDQEASETWRKAVATWTVDCPNYVLPFPFYDSKQALIETVAGIIWEGLDRIRLVNPTLADIWLDRLIKEQIAMNYGDVGNREAATALSTKERPKNIFIFGGAELERLATMNLDSLKSRATFSYKVVDRELSKPPIFGPVKIRLESLKIQMGREIVFHEALHAARADNNSVAAHSMSFGAGDVVYACAWLAYPIPLGDLRSSCETCALASRLDEDHTQILTTTEARAAAKQTCQKFIDEQKPRILEEWVR